MNYASRTSRLFGQLIDALIAIIPVIVAAIIAFVSTIDSVLTLGGIASAAYLLFADGRANGQSIGKRMLNMRVIDEKSGEPCSYGRSFLRNMLLLVLGPIDWIFIFGGKHQRLGDKLAGTVVISTS